MQCCVLRQNFNTFWKFELLDFNQKTLKWLVQMVLWKKLICNNLALNFWAKRTEFWVGQGKEGGALTFTTGSIFFFSSWHRGWQGCLKYSVSAIWIKPFSSILLIYIYLYLFFECLICQVLIRVVTF